MKKFIFTAIFVIIAPFTYAENFYQLVQGQDGKMYRIDSRSGKTEIINGSQFTPIKEEKMPQLIVNKVYRGEDGKKTYKYIGNGEFQEWGIEKYFR